MSDKWSLILLLLGCSCVVGQAATTHEILFNEDLGGQYPASNPLVVLPGDTVAFTCDVVTDIYRYEMDALFAFQACVTRTPDPLLIGLCTQDLIDLDGFKQLVRILDSPSPQLRYSPGVYYFVGYLNSNRTYPSGPPCDIGAKMALRVMDPRVTDSTDPVMDPRVTDSTDEASTIDGTAVDGTAADGLSSSDGPLLDTTQIIIVAVAASIGSLVACGVLLLIILLCVLAKRGRKGNMSTKPDVESDRSKSKHPEPKEQEKKKNSSIPKTEGKTDLTERSSVDGATKSNGKEVPKRKTKKTEPSLPSKTETDKGLPNEGTRNIGNGKRNIGTGT